MPRKNHGEEVWIKFAKAKYPGLIINSPEYNERRHSFFVGMWTALGFVQKIPESQFVSFINELHAEVKAVLTTNSTDQTVSRILAGN